MQLLCLSVVPMSLLAPLGHKKAAAVPPAASRSDLIQSTAQSGIFSRAPLTFPNPGLLHTAVPELSLARSGIYQHSKWVRIPQS